MNVDILIMGFGLVCEIICWVLVLMFFIFIKVVVLGCVKFKVDLIVFFVNVMFGVLNIKVSFVGDIIYWDSVNDLLDKIDKYFFCLIF